MRLAYVHALPLEYYPPATNTLDILAEHRELEVLAISTYNTKGRTPYSNPKIRLLLLPTSRSRFRLLRVLSTLAWHMRAWLALERFRPDAVFYLEPHSAIGVAVHACLHPRTRVFIHHHEYYAPGDFQRAGLRLPRLGNLLERHFLFKRAVWVSQTNQERLELLMANAPTVRPATAKVLPNHPPRSWYERPPAAGRSCTPTRMVYVGALSFEDTYVREIVEWVLTQHDTTLTFYSYNATAAVRDWLAQQDGDVVSFVDGGVNYSELPALLPEFDVGLVLYKGNTQNFIYNVPNKVLEYLACGLKVCFPTEMTGVREFCRREGIELTEVDFRQLEGWMPPTERSSARRQFTAEAALEPLIRKLTLK